MEIILSSDNSIQQEKQHSMEIELLVNVFKFHENKLNLDTTEFATNEKAED